MSNQNEVLVLWEVNVTIAEYKCRMLSGIAITHRHLVASSIFICIELNNHIDMPNYVVKSHTQVIKVNSFLYASFNVYFFFTFE